MTRRASEWFGEIERQEPPDLWPEIRARDPRPSTSDAGSPHGLPSGFRRALIVLVAFVVALGSFVFFTDAFHGAKRPVSPPTPTLRRISGFVISFDDPGWDARVSYPKGSIGPLLEATNFHLPPVGGNLYRSVHENHGISIQLME